MDEVIVFVGFSNKLVVDAKGIFGGLCLMWKVGTSVNLVEFNKNLIAVTISDVLCKWILVGFYGPPYESKKKKAWGNLMALLESLQDPWVYMGDFNYTISENEKFGGKKSGSSMNNYLQDLLFEFGAIDLGFSGSQFTWAKGNWGRTAIKRRLDRAISSISWRLAFPKASITHLGTIGSDHTPILLNTNPMDYFAHRPFRFEAAWARGPRRHDVILEAWNEDNGGSKFIRLCRKQEATRKALRKWNKEMFGKCQDRIQDLIQKITKIQECNPIIIYLLF